MMQTKLYRNLYELIHPSISRKNITEYSIVLNDNVLPIKVFYPKIGVELNRVILYLPDVKQISEFYKKMAEELNSVVLLVENDDNRSYIKTIEYINEELKKYLVTDNFSIIIEGHYCDEINSINFELPKTVYLNPTNNLNLNYQSIIITNNKEIDGDDIFHYKGEFTHAMNEDGLAIREKIFSTIRNFIN